MTESLEGKTYFSTTAAPTDSPTIVQAAILESMIELDTTTITVEFDANNFCASQPYGYFAYPTGCVSYVYCHVFNDVMIGNIYECLGTTRFNPELKYCEDGYTC